MRIDDFIRDHANQLRSAYSNADPPGFNRRERGRGWVAALGAVAVVVLLLAPVALWLRSDSDVGPGTEPPVTIAPTSAPETPLPTSVPGPSVVSTAVRCAAGGVVVTGDREIGYASTGDALAMAANENDLTDFEFDQESTSDTWVAGSSADPDAIIDLSQPDGSRQWFVDTVTICSRGTAANPITQGPSDEFTALPYRLLIEDADVGNVYVTDVAASTSELAALWSELGLVGQPPEVDFEASVVFYFGAVESSSCPLGQVEGLTYNEAHLNIYPEIPIVIPPGTEICTDDANRHAVLVAVERAELPEGGFSLWISADDPPDCCLDGVTFVAPNELTAPPDAAYPPLGASGSLGVGESRVAYGINTHCGVEWLLVSINEQFWRAVDLDRTDAVGIDPVPSAWGQYGESLDLIITLLDDTTLEVTDLDAEVTVTYTPDPDFPGCD